MDKEDFVIYEQALALKKLGFSLTMNWYYTNDGALIYDAFKDNHNLSKCYASAPTLAQAQKWLITKGLLIVPYSMSFESWQIRICRKGEPFLSSELYEDFYSYEEALSAGITECLKLLENE